MLLVLCKLQRPSCCCVVELIFHPVCPETDRVVWPLMVPRRVLLLRGRLPLLVLGHPCVHVPVHLAWLDPRHRRVHTRPPKGCGRTPGHARLVWRGSGDARVARLALHLVVAGTRIDAVNCVSHTWIGIWWHMGWVRVAAAARGSACIMDPIGRAKYIDRLLRAAAAGGGHTRCRSRCCRCCHALHSLLHARPLPLLCCLDLSAAHACVCVYVGGICNVQVDSAQVQVIRLPG